MNISIFLKIFRIRLHLLKHFELMFNIRRRYRATYFYIKCFIIESRLKLCTRSSYHIKYWVINCICPPKWRVRYGKSKRFQNVSSVHAIIFRIYSLSNSITIFYTFNTVVIKITRLLIVRISIYISAIQRR